MGQGGGRKRNDTACAALEMSGPPITLVSEGSRTVFPLTAAVGVRRPLPQNPGFGSGRCRGQDPSHRIQASAQAAVGVKTPPTESRLRPRFGSDPCGNGLGRDTAAAICRCRYRPLSGSRPLPQNPGSGHSSGAIPLGAALAATGPLQSAGVDAGRCRGQDPSHRIQASATVRERSLWERPWPRQGRCNLEASIQAAVGVKTPLPKPRLRPYIGRSPLPKNTPLPRQNHPQPTQHRVFPYVFSRTSPA